MANHSATLDETKDMTDAEKATYWFDLYLEETTKRRHLERELRIAQCPIHDCCGLKGKRVTGAPCYYDD